MQKQSAVLEARKAGQELDRYQWLHDYEEKETRKGNAPVCIKEQAMVGRKGKLDAPSDIIDLISDPKPCLCYVGIGGTWGRPGHAVGFDTWSNPAEITWFDPDFAEIALDPVHLEVIFTVGWKLMCSDYVNYGDFEARSFRPFEA